MVHEAIEDPSKSTSVNTTQHYDSLGVHMKKNWKTSQVYLIKILNSLLGKRWRVFVYLITHSEQDEKIDELHDVLKKLLYIQQKNKEEIDAQNPLLDRVAIEVSRLENIQMDITKASIDAGIPMVEQMNNPSSNCYLWLILICEAVILVVLLIIP